MVDRDRTDSSTGTSAKKNRVWVAAYDSTSDDMRRETGLGTIRSETETRVESRRRSTRNRQTKMEEGMGGTNGTSKRSSDNR